MFIEFARPDDPFRVQSGSSHIADDLHSGVLFTTRWPGAFAELLTVPVSVGANEVSGTLTYGRSYSTIPLVIGAVDRSSGASLYPSAYTYGVRVSATAWSVVNDYIKLEANTNHVRYRLCSQASPPYSGSASVVLSVQSATQMTLAKPWAGPTLTNVPYFILRWIKHTDPRLYGVRVSDYLTRLRAIPEDFEAVGEQVAADAAQVALDRVAAAASAATATAQANIAATQAANALSTFNTFRRTYYGALAADPVADPLGGALGAGDLYFNTTTGKLRIRLASSWSDAALDASGALLKANNLSDLADLPAARNTLVGSTLMPRRTLLDSFIVSPVAFYDITLPAGFGAFEITLLHVSPVTSGATINGYLLLSGGEILAGIHEAVDYISAANTHACVTRTSPAHIQLTQGLSNTAHAGMVKIHLYPGGQRHPAWQATANGYLQSLDLADSYVTRGLSKSTTARLSGFRLAASPGNLNGSGRVILEGTQFMTVLYKQVDSELVPLTDEDTAWLADRPPATPLMAAISDRQFFQQLALDGEITEAEAEDAVATGTVPAALLAVIEALPAGSHFAARMFLKGATSFERYHPMTETLGQLMGWDSVKLDALWTKAAALKRETTAMASTSLARSLALVFGHEGGFSDDRHDRGNWTTGRIGSGVLKGTKFGIAAMSYPTLDIENLTLAQAAAIYRKDYAAAIRFDELPAGIDHAVLDFAINSGPSRAVIGLQRAVGVADDGEMGPLTVEAVKKSSPTKVIRTLCAERLAFLRQLSTWPRYKNGWTTRVKRVEQESLAMAATAPGSVPPPPNIVPSPATSTQPASRGLFAALSHFLKGLIA